MEHSRPPANAADGGSAEATDPKDPADAPTSSGGEGASPKPSDPTRIYGTVDLDMVRSIKAFDAISNSAVMELQRSPGAKVKIAIEVEAQMDAGFDESDIAIVRHNARQLKFRSEST